MTGHWAMSAQCPVCQRADTTGRFMSRNFFRGNFPRWRIAIVHRGPRDVAGRPDGSETGRKAASRIRARVPMGSRQDVGHARSLPNFFLGGKIANGAAAISLRRSQRRSRWSMGRWAWAAVAVDGRTDARAGLRRPPAAIAHRGPETLRDGRWLLASRWSEQRAPDAPGGRV